MRDAFLASLENHQGNLVLGYGSLLSHCSRAHHSNIDKPALPVLVSGWKRSWMTRARHENQTYVGASPNGDSQLNAALFAVDELDHDLRLRERDYEFLPVDASALTPVGENPLCDRLAFILNQRQILICKTLQPQTATQAFPVYQSYLDTCMQGCLEIADDQFARVFVEQTAGLLPHWLNDRAKPRYPRAARLTAEQQFKIDQLLDDIGVLSERTQAQC